MVGGHLDPGRRRRAGHAPRRRVPARCRRRARIESGSTKRSSSSRHPGDSAHGGEARRSDRRRRWRPGSAARQLASPENSSASGCASRFARSPSLESDDRRKRPCRRPDRPASACRMANGTTSTHARRDAACAAPRRLAPTRRASGRGEADSRHGRTDLASHDPACRRDAAEDDLGVRGTTGHRDGPASPSPSWTARRGGRSRGNGPISTSTPS